jgi:large subunit ribosomal protein L22
MAAVAATDRDVFRARARFVRTSARKARLVLDHVRGLGAVEAEAVLRFETRAVARDVAKVLKSAVSNAEANFGHDADELIVVAAYADEGPTLKRWRPRARGRVNRIRKRTCHITLELAVAEPGELKRRERTPRRRTAAGASTRPESAAAAAAPAAAAAREETVVEPEETVAGAAEEAAPEAAADVPAAADGEEPEGEVDEDTGDAGDEESESESSESSESESSESSESEGEEPAGGEVDEEARG